MSFADAEFILTLYFYVILLTRLYKAESQSITNLFSLCLEVYSTIAEIFEIIGITKVALCTIIASSTQNQTLLIINDNII